MGKFARMNAQERREYVDGKRAYIEAMVAQYIEIFNLYHAERKKRSDDVPKSEIVFDIAHRFECSTQKVDKIIRGFPTVDAIEKWGWNRIDLHEKYYERNEEIVAFIDKTVTDLKKQGVADAMLLCKAYEIACKKYGFTNSYVRSIYSGNIVVKRIALDEKKRKIKLERVPWAEYKKQGISAYRRFFGTYNREHYKYVHKAACNYVDVVKNKRFKLSTSVPDNVAQYVIDNLMLHEISLRTGLKMYKKKPEIIANYKVWLRAVIKEVVVRKYRALTGKYVRLKCEIK